MWKCNIIFLFLFSLRLFFSHSFLFSLCQAWLLLLDRWSLLSLYPHLTCWVVTSLSLMLFRGAKHIPPFNREIATCFSILWLGGVKCITTFSRQVPINFFFHIILYFLSHAISWHFQKSGFPFKSQLFTKHFPWKYHLF